MAETLTQLKPVDAEKGYPQWGTEVFEVRDGKPVVVRVEWNHIRQPESTRYRETYGPFAPEATYEIVINRPDFPDPFRQRKFGSQIAGPNAERQANYPFDRIGELPLFYLVT